MIERDARQLHLQQLVHRQLAARVREADDDTVHGVAFDDRRNVLDGADDAGGHAGRTYRARVRVDEADNLDAELAASVSSRPSEIAAAFVPTSSSRSRGPTGAPAIRTRRQPMTSSDDQDGSDQENAAADDRPGTRNRRRRGSAKSSRACTMRMNISRRSETSSRL